MHKKSFIKGAAILGAAGLIVKLVGIFFKIPLVRIIGAEGAGFYGKAYPIYTILLMISTAGLPPAISKLVSERMALGDKEGARKVFRFAFMLLGVLGLISSLVLYFFSGAYASFQGYPEIQLLVKCISPAIFFVAIMASVRGYFQGLHNMFPTAMTQIVEQVGKVAIGLTLASIMIKKGVVYGAAGAIIGVMSSEFIALCVIVIYYFARREKVVKRKIDYSDTTEILKNILRLSIPILLGASVMPLIMLADSVIITARLEAIGMSSREAIKLFGIFSQFANPLVNVPGTVSLAFGVSILPIISAAKSTNSYDDVKHNSRMGFKMAMLVGIPSAVGLAVLASPIMKLLYGPRLLETSFENPILLAGNLLAILAGGVIFLSILQTLNGVLQGLGKVMVPVIALGLGAVAKVILAYWLIGVPQIGIYGAPISTFVCYLIAAVVDIVMVKRITGVKFGIKECVLRPAAASILMGAAAWGTYAMFHGSVGNSFATLIAVFTGVIVFIVCIPIFSVLRRTEILGLPGGSRMVKMYDILSRGKKDE